MNEDKNYLSEERFRAIAGWLVFVGTAIFSVFFLGFLITHSWGENAWIVDVAKNHFAAMVGLPLAAIAAICVVLLFKYATGPMEFKILGLEFRGSAGPVVLWVFCFLSIALAIYLLW